MRQARAVWNSLRRTASGVEKFEQSAERLRLRLRKAMSEADCWPSGEETH